MCYFLQVQQPAVSLSEHTHCGAPTSITAIPAWSVLYNSAPTKIQMSISKYPLMFTFKAFLMLFDAAVDETQLPEPREGFR